LHLIMMLGETAMPHTTDNSRYAARLITHGPFARAFWAGAVAFGGLVPFLIILAAPHNAVTVGLAAILALAGLLIFEWCFVMAGQSVPNS
jgi:Ni/Fe-hydrogenase subunit HybB-like protein